MPRLFVDNLTAIDCSVLDPERGLIGASWQVNIELHGELDEQSMVFDFSDVKKTIKRVIDEQVDHKLVVPAEYKDIDLQDSPAGVEINFADRHGQTIYHRSPANAVCELPAEQVDTEAIESYLQKKILTELPSNVIELSINLTQESANGHYYCYSHGLKKHTGNCQRIAHGHRSQIQIWRDGKRNDQLEKMWAQRWQDIYIDTEADVVAQQHDKIGFAYTSEQGKFELSLPEQRVHLMPNDSTVECIAEHIRELLLRESAGSEIKVKAFEGINKGAIAD